MDRMNGANGWEQKGRDASPVDGFVKGDLPAGHLSDGKRDVPAADPREVRKRNFFDWAEGTSSYGPLLAHVHSR